MFHRFISANFSMLRTNFDLNPCHCKKVPLIIALFLVKTYPCCHTIIVPRVHFSAIKMSQNFLVHMQIDNYKFRLHDDSIKTYGIIHATSFAIFIQSFIKSCIRTFIVSNPYRISKYAKKYSICIFIK